MGRTIFDYFRAHGSGRQATQGPPGRGRLEPVAKKKATDTLAEPRQQEGHRNQSEESELVRMTARLALAHEDSLSMQRADKGFILHFSPVNLIPALMALSAKWKTRVSSAQGHLPEFAPLCDPVQVRGSGVQANLGGQGHAALRDPPGRHLKFRMLRWDSSTQTMVVDDHRPTMNCTDTESRLQTLVAEAAESTNVIRFHATRPMQNSQTKIIVILELSSRAAVLHRALLDLCGHPIWSLVSASLKQCGALRWHRLWRKSWRASSEDSDGARGCLAPRQRRPLAGKRGTAFPALGT